jgi:hypothetical protein
MLNVAQLFCAAAVDDAPAGAAADAAPLAVELNRRAVAIAPDAIRSFTPRMRITPWCEGAYADPQLRASARGAKSARLG